MSGSGQSARERLNELFAGVGEHDSTAQLAAAMAHSLDAVKVVMEQHSNKVLDAVDRITGKLGEAVATQTDASAAVVGRLQNSMLLLGGQFKKLADRLAIAEARIEMLEAQGETRQ